MKKENIDKKLEETYWKGLIFLIILLFLVVSVWSISFFIKNNPKEEKEENNAFCGVVSNYYETPLTGNANGKALFKANCATCHNKNMKADMTGPALGGVQERWKNEKSLYQFIRNSQVVIKSGDAYAVSLYEQYDKAQMTAFPNLTDEEIEGILKYIDVIYGF